jgi:uracil-DNA glycosylase
MLERLLAEVVACRLCERHLPLGPRPVFRIAASARLLIVGQAPGTRVHASGVPWDDASGERLRGWLAIDPAVFYDRARIAILPIGLCYPGRAANGGDLPPRPECAPRWHPLVVGHLAKVELTLLIGAYAQRYYLGKYPGVGARATVASTVERWRDFAPRFLPLPHPSWRTLAWEKRNPWFTEALLPDLRARVAGLLAADDGRDGD